MCHAHIASERAGFEVVAVNDLSDRQNLIYLYNYDSTYGKASLKAQLGPNGQVSFDGKDVGFHCERSVAEVPWVEYDVNVLVDATGVHDNVIAVARKLIDSDRVAKAIITHSPPDEVDRYVIMGVNDQDYDPTTTTISYRARSVMPTRSPTCWSLSKIRSA